MKTIYGLDQAETEALVASLGFPKFRAKQLLERSSPVEKEDVRNVNRAQFFVYVYYVPGKKIKIKKFGSGKTKL